MRRRTVGAGVALVGAAGVGLAVSATGKSPPPSVAGYLSAHARAGTSVGVAPGASAPLPATFHTLTIPSAAALVAAQPHWMVVANPPGADSATAWTIAHGTLEVSTSQARLYAVTPPPRTVTPPPRVVPPAHPSRRGRVPSHGTAPAPAPTVTVRMGDSFWAIAERVVEERTGRPPTASAVLPVWRAIVAANAARLPRPGDPDLIFPGQVLLIPPP